MGPSWAAQQPSWIEPRAWSGEARRPGGEGSWLLGASLQTALCPPGIAMRIGSTIHSQLRNTVYEMLASLRSLGQGEWAQSPG